jgi:hypothetical protein
VDRTEFILNLVKASIEIGHIHPYYAACEAWHESWNRTSNRVSLLASKYNNYFGQKVGFSTREWPTTTLGTHEEVGGRLRPEIAVWPVFPDMQTCFREHMELIQRSGYYVAARNARTGEQYVREISKMWSTDHARADKVLAVYGMFKSLWEAPVIARQ